MHRVLKLWLHPAFRAPMIERDVLELEAERGVVGDACYDKRRHVTIIFHDDWQAAAAELGQVVDPVGRRANVLVSGGQGLQFLGKQVRLGECVLQIHGETRPCERMEDAARGMMEALRSGCRAGVWGRVISGGTIRRSDTLMIDGE